MNRIRTILLFVAITAPSMTSADTIKFEDSMAILSGSCGKDIDDNCRGVNLDPTRLKDCLNRNQDALSARCKGDFPRAFDALQKRISARAAVWKSCERDAVKVCGETSKQVGKALECLLAAPPKGVTLACSQSMTAAGYR
jgi:hypothetical protein